MVVNLKKPKLGEVAAEFADLVAVPWDSLKWLEAWERAYRLLMRTRRNSPERAAVVLKLKNLAASAAACRPPLTYADGVRSTNCPHIWPELWSTAWEYSGPCPESTP